jgi:hypothetical protein
MLHTAEQFIEQGVSTSSTSGKPYWLESGKDETILCLCTA